jgi:hypothetical protein
MEHERQLLTAGVVAGILLGLGSFLLGCPLDTCVRPSLRLTQQQQQGVAW